MQDEIVISVHQLSKTFYITNEESSSSAHNTVREALANSAQRLVKLKKRKIKKQVKPVEEFQALNNVSFEIKKGSRVGIIGRNGAGKSTLLKILSNITQPTSGTVSVKGKVVSLLEVGTGFHAELTGRENIFLNGVILGMKRAEIREKFDEIVAFAEIEKFLDTPVKKYSSGMYMRLAFAIASHVDPDILILDEMLAVGDAEFQRKCFAKMEEISKTDGRTVLFVSHSIEAIRYFCDTGIFLKNGAIAAVGEIKSVAEAYIESYTQKRAGFSPAVEKAVYFKDVKVHPAKVIFGDNLVVTCTIVSDRIIEHYELGIGVSNSLDMRVGSAIVNGTKPLLAGEQEIRVNIPVTSIVPGDYKLSFGLGSNKTKELFDTLLEHPSFTVVVSEATKEFFQHWQSSFSDHIFNVTLA